MQSTDFSRADNPQKPYALVSSLLLLLLITLSATSIHKVLEDGDTGWHIMAGVDIVENLKIPHHDPFSSTAGDYRWMNMSWLWDIGAAAIDSFSGLYGVAVATIICWAGIIGFAAYLCVRNNAGVIATLITILAGTVPFMQSFLARPLMVSPLFLLLYILILGNIRADNGKFRQAWWLPFIMVLWVNTHGGFLAGFTVIGAFGLHELLQGRFRNFGKLVFFGAITAAVTLLNPLGYHIYEAGFRSLGGPLRYRITEWMPLDSPSQFIYPAIFLSSFLAGFRKRRLAETMLSFFWLFQAVLSARYQNIFFAVSVLLVAENFKILIERKKALKKKDDEYTLDLSKKAPLKVFSIVVALTLLFMVTPFFKAIIIPSGLDYSQMDAYPYEEIRFMEEHYPDEKYYNIYNYGGYIIYGTRGRIKTFIDGRAETAFPPDIVKDYIKSEDEPDSIIAILDKHAITGVIMSNKISEKHIERLSGSPSWELAFKGMQASVFIRKK